MRYRVLSNTAIKAGIAALSAADDDLRRVAASVKVAPARARPPGFAGLVGIIVEQQVSVAAGLSMMRKLTEGVGELVPDRVLAYDEDGLRQFSLSRQKARYCLELATTIANGALDLERLSKQNDASVMQQLTAIKGIGRWTAEIYLMAHLRRLDIFPSGDLALQVAVQNLKRLPQRPDPKTLDAIATNWSPWRSVAARLMWAHYRQLKTRAATI